MSFNKLHEIWRSKWLPLDTKLQPYESGVWSVLVCGNEVWKLTESAMRALSNKRPEYSMPCSDHRSGSEGSG